MFYGSLKYMRLLKGKKIAEKILKDLKRVIKKQKSKLALAVVLVGENKASEIYIKLKKQAAKKTGIAFFLYRFSKNSGEGEIIEKIKELNRDKKISGIIVQLPLPENLNTQKIINAISPEKDADGFHPENLKKFIAGKNGVEPVFIKAIIKILESIPRAELLEFQELGSRRKAVIITNSKEFGNTMKIVLKHKGITGQYIFYKNYKKSLSAIGRTDIVITAVGKPGLIKGDMVKKGAIIIDGGITKKGKKVLGDVDFESVKNKAAYLSPVPGGVGPATIACLLENVYLLSKKSR